jgi:rod shape-determining protein MreC
VAAPRRNRRPRTTLIILILASITIITLDARGGFHRISSGARSAAADAFSPVRTAVDDVVQPIGSFLAGAVHYGAVKQQNQRLQQELDQLNQQRASQTYVSQSLQQLKTLSALYHLPCACNLTPVPAEVTDYGTSNFAATIDISVGRADGVQLGMPVVGGGGLVGQVVQANHHTATVRLVTDGQSTVGVVYGPAPGAYAVLDGQGAGKPLAADLIPSNTALTNGEQFVTSGLQGAEFPGGIPVATVTSARTGATASQESVTLRPIADLEHLRYVEVLLWGPAT